MGLLRRKKEADVVIDLRDSAPRTRPSFGSPMPCPSCSGQGYLDHIDPFREVMYLHCVACWHKWDVSRAELEADDTTTV